MRRACFSAVFVVAALGAIRSQRAPAELIFHNATIHTADDNRPSAQAIAIAGDRIAAVGTNAEVLALRGPATQVIDAKGAAILPGLHDAHGHVVNLGASLQTLALRDTVSWEQIVGMVRRSASTAARGEWILGRGWDQNDWQAKEFPTHELLTAAAGGNPVFLTRIDGHAAIANQPALAAAGITRDTADPEGGRIVRDARGEATGVLIDTAMGLVSRRIPPLTPAQLEAQILLADAEMRRLGLTMVHDAGANTETVAAYKRLIDAGRLQTRLYVMLRGSLDMLRPHFAAGPIADYGNHHLAVRAIKIAADGALGSRGAALLEPYTDDPGNTGLLVTSPEEVYAQTLAASMAGFQTAVHAIGDRANRSVLDTFERVQREVPGSRALRLRVEHAQILDAVEIPRFARLNVIASMQATHATSDMPWAPTRLGNARIDEGAYLWQTLWRTGAIVANGSDFPVEQANPLLGFYASITRQDPAGRPASGWQPAQRLTRDQTLKSFTINAAFAAHAEQDLGSLTAGKLADLVVLSKDVMRVPPREILTARVTLTLVGGKITWRCDTGSTRCE
jgi:predicted amidohydrolase YtcJ